eukprot:7241469-Prorocentrum_lima.AAC.1
MTSSLVGSEMCIRDRSNPRPMRWLWRIFQILRRRAMMRHAPSVMNSFPVSYTHLTLPTICSV